MNANVIKNEKNIVTFTFQVGPEHLEEGMAYSYKKNKNRISLPGFRKGKVPRKLMESQFGPQILYDDALNFILSTEYNKAVEELALDTVARPDIDAKEIDAQTGVTFEVSVAVKPAVTLGQYKGLTVEKQVVEIAEEQVDEVINQAREKNSRTITVSDRSVKDGDMVNIDYSGTVDGVLFDGGTAENYDLKIGSRTFIDTFEAQVIGHSVGEEFDVSVTFPENYQSEALSGKAAVFHVKLNEISQVELPELTDEFAQDVSDFDTLEKYKEDIREKLKEEKSSQVNRKKEEALLDQIIANAQMDVPPVMIDNRIDQMVNDFSQNLQRQGLSLELYCQYMSTSQEQLRETFRQSAEKNVKARLVMEQVGKEESIEASQEEIENEVKQIAKNYGIEETRMMEIIGEEEKKSLAADIVTQKAMALVSSQAVEVEPTGNDTDAKEGSDQA